MKNKILIILIIMLVACTESNNNNIEVEVKQSDEQQNISPQKLEKETNTFDLVYKDLDDNEHRLSDYRGKWVIVNFWATWCAPCRKEMPDFVKLKEKYKDKLEIWGIDYEDSDIRTIKNFVRDFKINYPILKTDVYNPNEFESENTKGLPTTVIFNPKGEQHDKRVGPIHYKDLVEIIGLE